MAKIKFKRTSIAGRKPVSLEPGEIGINLTDRKIYAGNDNNQVIQLGNDPIITDHLQAKAGATIDNGLVVGGNASVNGDLTVGGALASRTSLKAPTGDIDVITSLTAAIGGARVGTLTATGKTTLADTKTGALEATTANITGAATVHSLMTPGSVSAGGNIVATGKISGGSVETTNVIATNDVSMTTATATGKVKAGSVETGAITATDITATGTATLKVVKSDSLETTAILASGNISSGSLVTSTVTATGKAKSGSVETNSVETGTATVTGAASVGTTLTVNGLTTLKGVATGNINTTGNINVTGLMKSATGEINSVIANTVNATGNITAGSITSGSISLTDYGNFDQRYVKTGTSMSSAERLTTPRTIAGVAFDGSANISIPAANVGALPVTGGTMSGSIAFNTTQANYDSASLNTGTSDGKNYLRQFRGGTSDMIWHETVQGNQYRLSTGSTDSTDEFLLTSSKAQFRSEVVSTNSNGFRIANGNYGAILRNDGANTYFLLTNSGDVFGGYNALRPLQVNNANGLVTVGNGLSVTGGVAVGGALSAATTGAFSGAVSAGSLSVSGAASTGTLTINSNTTSGITLRSATTQSDINFGTATRTGHLGINDSDLFIGNLASGKYLQMTHDGRLTYSGAKIYRSDDKPTPREIGTSTTVTTSLSGGDTAWTKIGTATVPQAASTMSIRITGGAGYNALPNQAQYADIIIRSNNGAANTIGLSLIRSGGTSIENIGYMYKSGNDYDIYVYGGAYMSAVMMTWDGTTGTNFVHNVVIGTTTPPAGLILGITSTLLNTKENANITGVLNITGTGYLKLSGYTNDIRGTYGDTIIRDHQNGNTTISASRSSASASTGGQLYLGFNYPAEGMYCTGIQMTSPVTATSSFTCTDTVFVGNSRRISVGSANTSAQNVSMSIWGNTSGRNTVLEFSDDSSWWMYCQRTSGGAVEFNVNGNANFNDVYIRSDKRLKTNLVKVDSAMDKVNQLTAYHYDKRADLESENYDRKEIGILADDLEKVLPEAVSITNGVKVISASGVNALLINALKEANKRIENLEAVMATK